MQEPDTLNTAIRLLALPMPYYKKEDEAVELIESYVDELPDHSFSDRLSSGNRAEVSRVIKNTVRRVYGGNDGQPEREKSTRLIQATVAAWRKRGFDPTDKMTWGKTTSGAFPLAKDFCWQGAEVIKLGTIQKLLHCGLKMASEVVKHFLRLVKAHQGELAVVFVQRLLERFGIHCGHHGKANQFLALLRQWDWIRVTAWERWHERDSDGQTRKGRARTYMIGQALLHKFEEAGSSGRSVRRVLHFHPRKKREEVSIITSHCSMGDPFTPRKDHLDEAEFRTEEACTRALLTECDTERNKGSPHSWDWRHSQDQGKRGMAFSYAQDQ